MRVFGCGLAGEKRQQFYAEESAMRKTKQERHLTTAAKAAEGRAQEAGAVTTKSAGDLQQVMKARPSYKLGCGNDDDDSGVVVSTRCRPVEEM